VEVILSIKVEVNPVVSESFHILSAARFNRTLRVRGTHVRGPFANDVDKCHLVFDHLGLAEFARRLGKRIMRPSMGSNLMSFGHHTFDQVWIWSSGVNSSLAVVIPSDEKGSREAILLQKVKKLSSILCWSIVIGECNDALFLAVIYILSIGDGSFRRARSVGG
jgi:hypothetical protein